jgi:hypothetical protein
MPGCMKTGMLGTHEVTARVLPDEWHACQHNCVGPRVGIPVLALF